MSGNRVVTEVILATAPHQIGLVKELRAVEGVASISVLVAKSYPGTCVLRHNPLTADEQEALVAAAINHDASKVPSLSVDLTSQVIAADGETTGEVTVSDSRAALAAGKRVRLRFPPGGSAGANGDSFVLDSAGRATVVFQATTTFTGVLTFSFYYENAEADEVSFNVRRGTR